MIAESASCKLPICKKKKKKKGEGEGVIVLSCQDWWELRKKLAVELPILWDHVGRIRQLSKLF